MTDKELLNWVEHEQACITHGNHKFNVEVYGDRDALNKDSLRKAIENRMKQNKKDDQ